MPGTIIDMHLHTTKGASDSMLDPDELIAEATRVGLTGVNITEHDRMWESWDLNPFRKKHADMFVNNGMEVSTDMGHILAIGLKGYASGIRRLEKLREIADEQGAFLVVAHPFRHFFDPVTAKREGKKPFDLYPEQAAHLPVFQLVHGIEVLNGCNTPRENYFALQVAKIMGKPGTGGSDAHSTQGIGYFTAVFDETIETTEQMVSQMHLGRFHPGRGLPDGNLNNYWETAEPVPFYE
ncbi:MAG TPA: PHP domain-containing protein [Tepidiformaceae bacterium]|nr:PHP domain-containing protein [Thermoflexaceae bacterium]HMS59082.1 PHP domain-containing protein [Tepidiformaceae bacterium]